MGRGERTYSLPDLSLRLCLCGMVVGVVVVDLDSSKVHGILLYKKKFR